LNLERGADDCSGRRIETGLPCHKDELAQPYGLRIGAASGYAPAFNNRV
jgi:hypothetical protein